MEEFMSVSKEEEITHLYSLLRRNPNLLDAFDNQRFADTPLHLVAGQGRTQLALEIQRLMPSFGRKLNPDGFSPLDLALRGGHGDTVIAMVKLDSQLICVQGREGMTPLHCAAERDAVHFLAEFLLICPNSINELTVHGESAVHVAAKNGNSAAIRALIGWLKRMGRSQQVLGWRDWEGNTALHLAALYNQPEIVKLLVRKDFVNDKNSKGLTALDMAMEHSIHVNGRALQILHQKKAKTGSSIPKNAKLCTLVDFLSSPITILEWMIKFNAYLAFGMSSQMRNSILVVAVLIATATFQAALQPPGGFNNQGPSTNATSTNVNNGNGTVAMPEGSFPVFAMLNSIALAASLGTIYLVLPVSPSSILLHVSLSFLMSSYIVAIKATSPLSETKGTVINTTVSNTIFVVITCLKFLHHWKLDAWGCRRLIGSSYFYNTSEVRTLVIQNRYLSKDEI